MNTPGAGFDAAKHEYLVWLGCAGAFEADFQKSLRSLFAILRARAVRAGATAVLTTGSGNARLARIVAQLGRGNARLAQPIADHATAPAAPYHPTARSA